MAFKKLAISFLDKPSWSKNGTGEKNNARSSNKPFCLSNEYSLSRLLLSLSLVAKSSTIFSHHPSLDHAPLHSKKKTSGKTWNDLEEDGAFGQGDDHVVLVQV